MAKEMDLMKVGLYALAGFGAFAVYNKYIANYRKISNSIAKIQQTYQKYSKYI